MNEKQKLAKMKKMYETQLRKLKEEKERLNELSPALKKRYATRAKYDRDDSELASQITRDPKKKKRYQKDVEKRNRGLKLAVNEGEHNPDVLRIVKDKLGVGVIACAPYGKTPNYWVAKVDGGSYYFVDLRTERVEKISKDLVQKYSRLRESVKAVYEACRGKKKTINEDVNDVHYVHQWMTALSNAIQNENLEAIDGLIRKSNDWMQDREEQQAQVNLAEAVYGALEELIYCRED